MGQVRPGSREEPEFYTTLPTLVRGDVEACYVWPCDEAAGSEEQPGIGASEVAGIDVEDVDRGRRRDNRKERGMCFALPQGDNADRCLKSDSLLDKEVVGWPGSLDTGGVDDVRGLGDQHVVKEGGQASEGDENVQVVGSYARMPEEELESGRPSDECVVPFEFFEESSRIWDEARYDATQ